MFPGGVQVTILLCTLYKHVVHVYFDILPNLLDKHFIHKLLVRCPYILQSKRQDLVTEEPLAREK